MIAHLSTRVDTSMISLSVRQRLSSHKLQQDKHTKRWTFSPFLLFSYPFIVLNKGQRLSWQSWISRMHETINKLMSVFYVSVLLLMTKMSQSAHEKLNSHSLEAQGEERKRERAQGARCITGILSTFRRFPWSPREPISEEQGGHRWGCGQRIKFSQVRNMSGNSVYIVSEKKSTF